MTEVVHAGHCCLNCPQPSCTFLPDLFPVCFFLFFVCADAWRFSVKDPADVWPCFPTKTTHIHTCYNNNFSFTTNPSEGLMSTKRKMKAKMPYNNHENESPGELDTDVFLRINLHIGNLQRQIQYSHTQSTEGEIQCSQTLRELEWCNPWLFL